ncbi:MAG: RibD family protein, partial [Beijerinckiaceae bacterium]
GARTQISSDTATRQVHLIRARHDAIMVGIGTVLADDPLLNVRLPGLESQSPVRVVLDSALRLPLQSRLVKTAHERPVWVIATTDAPSASERALVDAGVEVMRVDADAAGRIDLSAALALLGVRGITRVFSEGGPVVAEQLARDDLIDDMIISTSQHALGSDGVVAIRPGLQKGLSDPARFRLRERAQFDTDIFETFERIG